MKKIIQISESEYNRLYELANANKEEIAKRAKEEYENKGFYRLEVDFGSNSLDTPFVQSLEYDSKNFADIRNYVESIRTIHERVFQKQFGEHLHILDNVKRLKVKQERLMSNYLVVTVTGWLVAIALLLVALLK